MFVRIEFSTGNASFEDDFDGELDSILHQAADKIRRQMLRPKSLCDAPESADVIIDINGNTIGTVSVRR